MNYITQDQVNDITFNYNLNELYKLIKGFKLKKCVTIDKKNNTTETAKILKKFITKRAAGTNEIFFKMDDFINWSIHEYNFNEIVLKEDSIQLFDNELYTVTFTK
ncbi:hypothetical protein [Bacillus xiapuensis]|uniref:Uncharacterized protein n=1 Tax=Bacillus xiapuensis TaxID=2014075 RepID=A0ABU6N7V9_9BACI|nr:hypothetical protein [Bacillus xiapuensis]